MWAAVAAEEEFHMRELAEAEAVRIAGAVDEDYRTWHSDMSRVVGPGV